MTPILARATLAVLVVAMVTGAVVGADRETAKKLVAIDIKLEAAATRYELALRQFKEIEDQERRDNSVSATRLSHKLSLINTKYDALSSIDKLLDARIKEGESLPRSEQLAFVQDQLRKARERKEKDPGATTLGTVLRLMNVEAALKAGEKKRR